MPGELNAFEAGVVNSDRNWLQQLWADITGVTAAEEATAAMTGATTAAIEEQRRQFEAMQLALAPYMEAGESALQEQLALTGALGDEAYEAAIARIQESPEMQAMIQQGEEAILQGASATGGLRGGNVQGALAQFRPQILGDMISQRYAQLGGLSGMGQASAAGVGSAGIGMGGNVGNLFTQQGQLTAENILAQYNLQRNAISDLAGLGLQIGALASGGF